MINACLRAFNSGSREANICLFALLHIVQSLTLAVQHAVTQRTTEKIDQPNSVEQFFLLTQASAGNGLVLKDLTLYFKDSKQLIDTI